MTLQHPVQVIFDNLTHILEHALPASKESNAPCDCCGRNSAVFGNKIHAVKDSYKTDCMHCSACESFNVSDIDIMGVESVRRGGNKVGHKFGMMSGSGCVVTASGHVVLFTPPGTYIKLPPALLSQFNVVECTIGGQLEYLNKTSLDYPLVYIQNFGRKTYSLIQGLRWSLSRKALVVCTDDGNDSTQEAVNTIDLDKLIEINEIRQVLPKKIWTDFKTAMQRLSRGDDTPEVFTEKFKKLNSDELLKIYRLLPLDPHQRLAIISQLDKI